MPRKVSQTKIDKAKNDAEEVLTTAQAEVKKVSSAVNAAEKSIKQKAVKAAKSNKQLIDSSIDVASTNTKQALGKAEKYVQKNKTPLMIGAGVTAVVLALGKIIFRKK